MECVRGAVLAHCETSHVVHVAAFNSAVTVQQCMMYIHACNNSSSIASSEITTSWLFQRQKANFWEHNELHAHYIIITHTLVRKGEGLGELL